MDVNGFPSGSFAYHPSLQHCYVVKAKGSKCIVRYQDINADKLIFKKKVIPVAELSGPM